MERLINQKNASPMAIGQKLPMSFAIVNTVLAPNTRAIDLGIFPWATTIIAWKNSKNLEDGSFE
jgi:hypothetical protein